jgi:hypothetical protein
MFGRTQSIRRLVGARRAATVPLRESASPPHPENAAPPPPSRVDTLLAPFLKRKEAIEVVGAALAASAVLLTAAFWVMGWQGEVRELKAEVKNLKKSVPTKADLARVETKVDGVLKNASLKAENTALKAMMGGKSMPPVEDKASAPPSPSSAYPTRK